MSARIVPSWLGRLLAIAAWVACAWSSASALSVEYAFVPTDGTFRDASSLSRYERASLLAQRLAEVGLVDAEFARSQARELHGELAALGVEVANLAAPAGQWKVSRPTLSADEWEWGRSLRSWTLDRMTAIDAFWTDPSSPALRYAVVTESSGQPRISPPRAEAVDLLAQWTPPAPSDDFTLSSPEEVLPANARIALHPSLGIDFAFTPHPIVPEATLPRVVDNDSPALPSSATTLDALARIGLPAAPAIEVPSSLPSPLLQAAPTSALTPARTSEADARSPVYGPRFTPSAPVPRWRWSAGYQSSALLGDIGYDGSRSFVTGLDPIGAGTSWTHYAAGGGYKLPVQDVDVNVKFDEWTFGAPGNAFGAGLSGARSFGLDRMRLQDARLNVDLNVDPRFTLHGGYIYTRTSGLYTSLDTNLNISQDRAFPYLGFDYKISNNARWNVNIRFYNNPLDVSTTSTRSPLNLTDPTVTTEVKVRF